MEGGAQEFLMRLKESRLKDDELLEEFYDRIIESFDYGENYLILLVHGAYDIPGKSSDNEEMLTLPTRCTSICSVRSVL